MQAQWRPWRACSKGSGKAARVSRSIMNYLNGHFNLRVKRLTYWSTISLRWCPETAVHICYLFNLKRKHPLSPSPGACGASLALVSIHWGWSAATVWWGQEQLLGMSGSCAQKQSVKSCEPQHILSWPLQSGLTGHRCLVNWMPFSYISPCYIRHVCPIRSKTRTNVQGKCHMLM